MRENDEDYILEEASFEELLEESDFEYDLDDYSGDEDGLVRKQKYIYIYIYTYFQLTIFKLTLLSLKIVN